jgi:DNA-binding NarL/FixJ family response regulator
MGDRRWRRGLARRPDDPHAGVLGLHEQRIVRALCEGLSREEVARRIQRSRSTLDKRIGLIYAATGFTAAYQVVAWAHRVGLCHVARGANGAADSERRARALAEEVSS